MKQSLRAIRPAVNQRPSGQLSFRTDIQGLRAVAVGIVLLYHAGMPWLPGGFVGVDVFFVISGFLITGGIVKEIRRDGKLSLKDFYVRRVARIIPAATLTLVSTVILSWVFLPQTRLAQVGADAMASAVYVVNWAYSVSAVDYLAQDQAPSPLQHFWSLAVEEQFYILWPVVLMVVAWLCLKSSFSLQKGLLIALAVVAVPSFVWSVYYTAANPGGAYFVTTTRMWELAIGAGLAIIASRSPVPPRRLAVVASWLGLFAILFAAITYTGALPFPSFTALLPTLGAAAVLWGGQAGGPFGVGLLLTRWPMTKLGEISYSLYLWHWPLLVIAGAVVGKLDPIAGLIVVALAVVPAWASTRYVEKPAQKVILEFAGAGHSRLDKSALGVILVTMSVIPALFLTLSVPPTPPQSSVEFVQEVVGNAPVKPVGAEALALDSSLGKVVEEAGFFTPTALAAGKDGPPVSADGCHQTFDQASPVSCIYGDTSSKFTVVLTGDSHAAHWSSALRTAAQTNGWRLETYTKDGCPFTLGAVYNGANDVVYENCTTWNNAVREKLKQIKPDVVITTALLHQPVVDGERITDKRQTPMMAEAIGAAWSELNAVGIPIISIVDSPTMGMVVPDCVSANPKKLSVCSTPRESALVASGEVEKLSAANAQNAVVVDMNDMVCPESRVVPHRVV